MVTPPPLRTGDTIAIVPTARAITLEELRPGVALAESWGLKVRLGAGVGRKDFQQAGTAGERAADLQQALADPEVKAVWCARGGYGTVHLLELLDLSILRSRPKWIVGFSDITVLHSALHHAGLASLHAQMPFNIAAKSAECTASLRQALFGRCNAVHRPGARPLDRTGTAHGVLIGGNLSILYALRGTPYDLSTRGKVLFIEDLDELLYHVDRMVMNLKLGGLFNGLAGLVVGGMSDMHDKDPSDPFGLSAEGIIARAVARADYPVCFGMPAGHLGDNRALALGQKAKLSVAADGATLSFADGGDAA
ncbi:MAG TPA: LD-carboxypeptidase [Flavobacteriales bacterium]|nr:LD-carboxypeptidase [Flavobacteriales bacterium]